MERKIDDNLEWIKQGHIGCSFARLFARNPKSINWVRIYNPKKVIIPKNANIISYIFPKQNIKLVRKWALKNGFYEEKINEGLVGLRYKINNNVSWVQYFGEDSHVNTRKAPNSELCFCVKMAENPYNKTLLKNHKIGDKLILHLAHSKTEHIGDKKCDKLWEKSFQNTQRIIGHKPTINEAAKTTYHHFPNNNFAIQLFVLTVIILIALLYFMLNLNFFI